MNDELKEIAISLCQFQNKCPQIGLNSDVEINFQKKDGTWGKLTFKYASLGHIITTIKDTLYECGLAFTHFVGDKGVKCVLMHSSGQSIESDWLKISASQDAKQQGSAITYAKRYTLVAILGLFAEEDIDAPADKGKKPISNVAFDKAVERILNGDPNVFIQVLMHFDVTQEQMEQLYELSLNKFGGKNE